MLLHLLNHLARSRQGIGVLGIARQSTHQPLQRKVGPMQPNVRQSRIRPGNKLSMDDLLQSIAVTEPLEQGGQPMRLPIMREVNTVDVPKGLPAILQKESRTPSSVKHTSKNAPSRLVHPELASFVRVARRLPGNTLFNAVPLNLPIWVHVCIHKLEVRTSKFQQGKAAAEGTNLEAAD